MTLAIANSAPIARLKPLRAKDSNVMPVSNPSKNQIVWSIMGYRLT